MAVRSDVPSTRSSYSLRRKLRVVSFAAIAALVLQFESAAIGGQVVFGIDNRPSAPTSIDPPGFGNGAEDPYGLVSSPTFVGPSPSLNVLTTPPGRTLSQADILKVGDPNDTAPKVDTRRPTSTNYIDEISSNRAPAHGRPLRLAFSVDRASVGVSASAVHTQFLLNQQPADIFLTDRAFPAPSQFVGTLVGSGWVGNLSSVGTGNSNVLLIDQSKLKLTAGLGPGNFIGPTGAAPPITPGSHDNVDAFDMAPFDTNGNLITDKQLYFSINPDQLAPGSYFSAADIYRTAPGSLSHTQFATAYSMGLDFFGTNSDDVDGLELYDRGVVGLLEPGIDYVLFSLAPGSQSLQHFSGLTAADVFFTDFHYSFATFARDADLGLSGTISPAELGGPGAGAALEPTGNDNLDALGSYPLGDMDWSGNVDIYDVDDFVQGLTRPSDYRDLDINHLGQPATVLGDFSVPRDGLVDFDDVVPFRNAVQGGGGAASGLSIPEPRMLALAAIVSVLLAGSRRTRRSWRWHYMHCTAQ